MSREYPDKPVVGVGGVVIENGRALLIRRGSEPLLGQWSIPGGTLELGESLENGVTRELKEETGLTVRIVEMIEVFDRIYEDEADAAGGETSSESPSVAKYESTAATSNPLSAATGSNSWSLGLLPLAKEELSHTSCSATVSAMLSGGAKSVDAVAN